MPRPERPLNPLAGPVQAFAMELRALRAQAGCPKYLQMARRTGRSRTALAEAAGGDHLPTWETVEAYVQACGADVTRWRLRWEDAQQQLRAQRDAQPPAPSPPAQPPPVRHGVREPGAGSVTRSRPAWVATLTMLVTVFGPAVVMTLVGLGGKDHQEPSVARPVPKTVRIADTALAPVKLSTGPVARCADRECQVPGVELWPGKMVVVSCYTGGDQMEAGGPERFGSNGWYGSLLSTGGMGYLAEVHIAPEFRGNPQGLEQCPQGWAPEGNMPYGNTGRRVPR